MADEEKKEVVTEKEESREEVAKRYYEENGGVEEEKAAPAPEVAEEKPEEKPKEEPLVKQEVKEEKKEKFVPYDALHEERIKRQAESKAKKAAEERAANLEAEIARLRQQHAEPETISDYDKEIIEIKRRQQAIENIEKDRVEREKHEHAEKIRETTNNQISQTDKDLESEGYPGFSHMVGSVEKELMRLVNEDETNIAMDTPSGWKRIYKEKIYPDVAAKFEATLKNRSLEDKIALKKEAGLVDKSGKAPHKEKEKDDISEEEARAEYLKMRKRLL